MAETTDDVNPIEQRLGSVEKQVTGLRGEVGGLRGEVGELRGEVGGLRGEVGELRGEVGELRGEVGGLRGEVGELRGEVGELRGEVHTLRVLAEHTASEVKLVAEVQGHHSKQLLEITTALEPLAEMHAFFKLVAGDHEPRIKELEKRVGVRE